MLSDPNPAGPYKAEATGEQIWRTPLLVQPRPLMAGSGRIVADPRSAVNDPLQPITLQSSGRSRTR